MRTFPVQGLPGALRATLRTALDSGASRDLVLTTVEDLPPVLPDGRVCTVLPGNERRDVLLGADLPLAELPPGTPVGLEPGRGLPRRRALLRALHPRLEPVVLDGADDGPSIRLLPLWPDPRREASGEVLDEATWLPAPGQGIPALLHGPGGLPPGIPGDPAASAVARAERAFRRGMEFGVVCVRGRSFGAGVRLTALVLAPEGDRVVRGALQAPLEQAEALGIRLARLLLKRGADLLPPASGS